jgi:hypothetical protein
VAPGQAGEIAGRRLLLVDDVMTSGASLYTAAQALRAAGAAHITALVLARTEPSGSGLAIQQFFLQRGHRHLGIKPTLRCSDARPDPSLLSLLSNATIILAQKRRQIYLFRAIAVPNVCPRARK